MARFTLIPIDFLVYTAIQFFVIQVSSYISLIQLNSLDPDTNVNHTGEIAYDCFIENQFNKILTNEYLFWRFSLLHLNTRSLSNNFNNLTDLLACLDIK